MRVLAKYGADISEALLSATEWLDVDMAAFLFELGADVSMKRGRSVGYEAISNVAGWNKHSNDQGQGREAAEKFLNMLLSRIKNPNQPDRHGQTLIFYVVGDYASFYYWGQGGVAAGLGDGLVRDWAIRRVLEQGANPRVKDKLGTYPVDLYRGNDTNILRVLAGKAPLANGTQGSSHAETPDVPQSRNNADRGSSLTGSSGAAVNSLAGEWQGSIFVSTPTKMRIDLTGIVSKSGDAIFSAVNGVRSSGTAEMRNLGKVVFRLTSKAPGNKVFADGSSETPFTMEGTVDAGIIRGRYTSSKESGEFVFCNPEAIKQNDTCRNLMTAEGMRF